MGLVIVPIEDGKLDTWKAFIEEVKSGSIKDDFADLNERYELTRHSVWHVETPAGQMAVVLHEGPGSDGFMQTLAHSDHSFDLWMKDKISEIHGMNFSEPPPGPPPQQVL